jgi:uncharacterized protein
MEADIADGQAGGTGGVRVLEELDEDHCRVLLRSRRVGRLATVTSWQEAPDVVPINFLFDGRTVRFRTHRGAMFERILNHPVSLQVDEIDPLHKTGWSVLVKGWVEVDPTEVPSDEDVTARTDQAELDVPDDGEVEPWTPDDQPVRLRFWPSDISGRRLRLDLPSVDGRGYL